MALSFQEAEGCASIWYENGSSWSNVKLMVAFSRQFVHNVQKQYMELAGDDALSDDMIDTLPQVSLPVADIKYLQDILEIIRHANATQNGRESLAKFLLNNEYLKNLIPLVQMAEDLESLEDLHRLCDIMKQLIVLNDNSIIELMISDENVMGVVGALEYDSDFPTHKANHRQYLSDEHRFKEVVKIKDPQIRKKIKYTWRLQYLKDVVLARIIDDPTFSVLNSIIFFFQVDIVQHLQSNAPLLKELFSIFDAKNTDIKRKEDAVHFLQHCAAVSKSIQAPARGQLFANFIAHGLFGVIQFAIKHPGPSMRTTGIDILVALLDHDPVMIRSYMLKAVVEDRAPLTDTLIDLLHVETDLGVKNQLADAIKVLLDPQTPLQEAMNRDFIGKMKQMNPSRDQLKQEQLAQDHFDRSCQRLFKPLKSLTSRPLLANMGYQEVSLFCPLLEILTFFVRQHSLRSRHFILSEQLARCVSQLLSVPQKALKLTALKFFRTCTSLQDEFYMNQVTQNGTIGLILDIVLETMPRDNLLNSACLELFEFIKRENIKGMIMHVVDNYREKLEKITYVDTFQNLILRYEQMQGYNPEMEPTLFSQEDDSPGTARNNMRHGQSRWQGLKEMEPSEEEYFNTSDDEEEDQQMTPDHSITEEGFAAAQNGSGRRRSRLKDQVDEKSEWFQGLDESSNSVPVAVANSPLVRPLVDYPDDDDEEGTATIDTPSTISGQEAGKQIFTPDADTDSTSASPLSSNKHHRSLQPSPEITSSAAVAPPERLSEKRRREEDEDEDELGKLSSGVKRRSSSSSIRSSGSLKRKQGVVGMRGHGGTTVNANMKSEDGKEQESSSPPTGKENGKMRIAISLGSSTGAQKASSPTLGECDGNKTADDKENDP
ncbi:MAG: hypothetical protein Q9160_001293 [Pyrenula sp. 1 TL-2023]